MRYRFGLHLVFWLAYWFIYAYTYSRHDGNLLKYLQSEGLQMPARIASTYASFWLLDFWSRKNAWWAFSGVALATIGGGWINRLLKMGYVVPVFFPNAPFQFWSLGGLMIDIFDCALATGTALSARLFFRQQESLRREARLQQEKTAAELRALKNQLQPHFLFNTINNLYALARMKSDKTAPVALQLANLLRFVLSEARKEYIPIEQEIKILRDFIALEQLRFDEERLQVEAHFDLDDPQQPIAPLLLLPLVENAFKHGVSEHQDEAQVRISVKLKAQQLHVRIDNTLFGAPRVNPDGIGLTNIHRQLELLYPGRSTLSHFTDPENEKRFSTVLNIKFPAETG